MTSLCVISKELSLSNNGELKFLLTFNHLLNGCSDRTVDSVTPLSHQKLL